MIAFAFLKSLLIFFKEIYFPYVIIDTNKFVFFWSFKLYQNLTLYSILYIQNLNC